MFPTLQQAPLQYLLSILQAGGGKGDSLKPSPNEQVASRFGGMAPSSMTPNDQVAFRFPQDPGLGRPTANQYVANNFPPVMAQGGSGVPTPQPRPPQAGNAPIAVGNNYMMPRVGSGFNSVPTHGIPMPQPRPAAANDGGLSFFQRNAMMMRDPQTGAFIDPQGAARAQTALKQQDQGSLMQKMLGYLGSKSG